MNNATMMPTNASLSELAGELERDPGAFERFELFQRRDVCEALHSLDDGAADLETLGDLAGEALETAADMLGEALERCEEQARAYMESQDYLVNYDECIKSELTLNADSLRQHLAELLGDELDAYEFEHIADEIAAGMHDGIAPNCPAPGDNTGPYGVAYDIWARDDAFITLGPGGDWQAFPVDDATEQRLGELLDIFNRLDAVGAAPRREFGELFKVELRDGAQYGLDAFAVMVDEPQQVLFYVDLESIAASLEEYRKARREETRERLEALRAADERELSNWPEGWREFVLAYREALAWSTTDNYNGEELESLEAFEFGEQAYEKTRADCLEFIRRGAYSLEDITRAVGYGWARAGHDFWLTRAGHGAGFWDRAELEHLASQVEFVCNLCDEFGEQWPYIGEDENGDAVIFVR